MKQIVVCTLLALSGFSLVAETENLDEAVRTEIRRLEALLSSDDVPHGNFEEQEALALERLNRILLPKAQEIQNKHCPNFFKRLVSCQSEDEKRLCEQAEKHVAAYSALQEVLAAEIAGSNMLRRCCRATSQLSRDLCEGEVYHTWAKAVEKYQNKRQVMEQ